MHLKDLVAKRARVVKPSRGCVRGDSIPPSQAAEKGHEKQKVGLKVKFMI